MGNRFGLPGISSKLPADVRQFLERVGEFVRTGDFASRRDLVDLGLAQYDLNGNLTLPDFLDPTGDPLDLTPPPAPTGLTASGAMTTIILTWDNPSTFYDNFAYTEVWRSATNDLGTAVLQGTTQAAVYSDAVGTAAAFFYWIRFVSLADVTGPYNGTEGTPGATAQDPGYLLEQLVGQITATQLHATLGERITAIAAVEAEIDTINATLADIEATPEYDPLVEYLLDQLVKYNGALYQAKGTTTGNLPTNTTFWTKVGDYASLGDAVAAHALQLTDHNTRITNNTNGLTAETTARQTLATQVRGNYTGTDVMGVSSGLLFSERTLRSTADATEVTARQALSAKLTGLNDPSGSTLAALTSGLIYDERTIRASTDEAIALDVTNLSTTVGNHTTSISTQQTSINGLSAQYTVKIDNNGYVSGFGLASNPVNDVPFSDFIIRADRFSVASPTGPGIDPIIPFVVTTTPTTIGGEPVPVGVFMDAAFIQNGTITNAKIGDAAIDNAKISNLDAAKITAGNITADRMQANIVAALTGKFERLSAITSLLGTVTIDPAGWIRTNGVTEYGVGIGFFLGYEEGAYKFRVGTPTLHMAWDGVKAVIGNPTAGRLEATNTGITVYDNNGVITLSSGGNLDWAKIIGSNKPANNATVGATIGSNLIKASGGTALATDFVAAWNKITTANIGNYMNSAVITNAYIADATILTAKIGNAQITNAKIDLLSANRLIVGTANIGDATITNAKIDRASVNKLSVGTLDIQGNAVTIPIGASGGWFATTAAANFENSPVLIVASGQAIANGGESAAVSIRLRRGTTTGTILQTVVGGLSNSGVGASACTTLAYNPGAGSHQFTVEVFSNGAIVGQVCNISVIGLKR